MKGVTKAANAVGRTDREPNRQRYPVLVVRMVPGVYQYREVPKDLADEEEMISHALAVSSDLGLRACLVLGPQRAWYCEPDGSKCFSDEPPSGGSVVGADAQFVCADGTVRKESPRGPIVHRDRTEEEGR